MIIDAFMQMIMANFSSVISYVILAVITIAALLAAAMVFESGAVKVLDFISGEDSSRPRVGYQYEEYVDGKPVYRTWTKKDQYYNDKRKSGR